MGISLEQWRVTIGNISCPSQHFSGNKAFSSKENRSVKLLIVIAIFLVIEGVESNPGPLFSCKACDTTCQLHNDIEMHFLPTGSSKCKSVTLNGFTYSKNMCLVLNGTSLQLKVRIIISICISKLNSMHFFIKLVTANFDPLMGLYALELTNEDKHELISFDDVKEFSYEPLPLYKIGAQECIVLKYIFPFSQ